MFYEVKVVTRKKNFYKNVQVSNSKWDVILHNSILQPKNFDRSWIRRLYDNSYHEWKLILRVSNSKWNLMFYKAILITWKKNFCKNVGVSISKCDVVLHNLTL